MAGEDQRRASVSPSDSSEPIAARRAEVRAHGRIDCYAPTKRYLTRREIEREYGISKDTLAHWASEGKGPPFSVPGRVALYLRDDVEAYLAAQRVNLPERAAKKLALRPPGRPRKMRRRQRNAREALVRKSRGTPPIVR